MTQLKILAAPYGIKTKDPVVPASVALARHLDAELVWLSITPSYRGFQDLGLDRDGITQAERKAAERAGPARVAATKLAERAAVAADWLDVSGAALEMLRQRSHDADFIMVDQRAVSDATALTARRLAGELATSSAPPVVMLPGVRKDAPAIGKRVIVAWNGSKEARRAITAALPLLQRAESVRVLHLVHGGVAVYSEHMDTAPLERYLARRGVEASFEETPMEDGRFGETLLAHAGAFGADLLVMGIFGHSRIRESLFGGVSAHVLSHATLPVLLTD